MMEKPGKFIVQGRSGDGGGTDSKLGGLKRLASSIRQFLIFRKKNMPSLRVENDFRRDARVRTRDQKRRRPLPVMREPSISAHARYGSGRRGGIHSRRGDGWAGDLRRQQRSRYSPCRPPDAILKRRRSRLRTH